MGDTKLVSEAVVIDIQKRLAKKATFEDAVKRLTAIVEKDYLLAPPALQRLIFEAINRTATLLQSRYTTGGFWVAGLGLFHAAQAVIQKPLEARQLQTYIQRANDFVGEQTAEAEDAEEAPQARPAAAASSQPFLFEGQLSSGANPPRPAWLVAQTAHFSLLGNLHEEPPARSGNGEAGSGRTEGANGIRQLEQELRQMAEAVARGLEGGESDNGMEVDGEEARAGREARSRAEEQQPRGRQSGIGGGEGLATDGDVTDRAAAGQQPSANENTEFSEGVSEGREDATLQSASQASNDGHLAAAGTAGAGDETQSPTAIVRERARLARERLLALLAAMREPSDGDRPGAIPDYLEVMRAAMRQASSEEIPGLEEALQATMQDAPRGPPPASKELVKNLPRVKVTEEVLSKLEAGTECSVCREDYVEGDVMQELPCEHTFHPECIGPWLEVNNSCPLCRSEMRTDDEEYERRKEREKEEREERRGVENALRQGEHMFI